MAEANFGNEIETTENSTMIVLNGGSNTIAGSKFTLPENALALNSITAYIYWYKGTAKIIAAVYDSGLNLVGQTEESTAKGSDGWAFAWVTVNFASPPSANAGVYWLVVNGYSSVGSVYFLKAVGDTDQALKKAHTPWDSFPNPLLTPTLENYEHCIYCTYEEEAVAGIGAFTKRLNTFGYNDYGARIG